MTLRQPLSRPRPSREASARAVALMGGAVQAAKKLCVPNYQTIQSWSSNGVPVAYCATVERLVDGRVNRRELYPDDWMTIWPELVDVEVHQARTATESVAGVAHA